MNLEKDNKESLKISEGIKIQLENLGLDVDEIKGRILDVGAGEALFCKELKKVTDSEIISIDNWKDEDTPDDVIVADVKELPFEDNYFNMVISHASIPNIFIGMYNMEFPDLSKAEIKSSIARSFAEILRVLKPGSKAVMAPIRIANNYNPERALATSLREVIKEIQNNGTIVLLELIEEVENPENQEKYKEYRLTLFKK